MLANGDIFHGDYHPVSVVAGRKSRNLANPADLSNRIRYYTTAADYTHVKYWGNFELIEASGVEVSISYKHKGTGNPWWSISQYDENGKLLTGQTSSAYSSTGGTRRVVGKYVSFSLWDGTDLKAENNPFYDIQVEFGETLGSTPTEYVPYTSMETLFKPTDLKKSGTSLTFEQSYNHSAEVEVAGKSEQVQLSGKNLYNSEILVQKWFNSNGYVDSSTGFSNYDNPIKAVPGSTYTLKTEAICSSLEIAFTDADKNYISRGWAGNTDTLSATAPSNAVYVFHGIYGFVSEAAYKSVVAQLELGSTATPYEPYCGGIPSPNPDYPQPIESVESVELVSRGRNLWNPDGATWTYNTTTQTLRGYYFAPVSVKAGEKYTIHYEGNASAGYVVISQELFGTNAGWVFLNGGYPTFTVTAESDTLWVARYGNLPDGNIQIEQGTIAHPYEPYHSTTRTINLQGNQLRSLPDGTHDELRVKRDGSVELVKRVDRFSISDYTWTIYQRDNDPFWWTRTSLDGSQRDVQPGQFMNNIGMARIGFYVDSNMTRLYMPSGSVLSGQPQGEIITRRMEPQTIALPSIDPLPTYWPTTVVDGNGLDISAYVKVVD